jgi:DNA-binding SARP family transcriptional activator
MDTLNATVVHLLAGPYITVGPERREVPEGSKQLLVFVVLRRRRVERRQAAGALWPLGDEERAAGNLRSALWRLRLRVPRIPSTTLTSRVVIPAV